MTKQEFIAQLRTKLSALPPSEIDEHIDFYAEMIADRIEDGASEEDAVLSMGNVNKIADQIISDIPLTSIVKKQVKEKKRISALDIVLLVLASPIWLPLVCSFAAIILSLYIVLWSLVAVCWSMFASFIALAVSSVIACVIFTESGNILVGIAITGAGIFCAGAAIFSFFGCIAATKAVALIPKKIILKIKKHFINRGEHNE